MRTMQLSSWIEGTPVSVTICVLDVAVSTYSPSNALIRNAITLIARMTLGSNTWITVLCRKLRDWWHWVAEGELPIVANHGYEDDPIIGKRLYREIRTVEVKKGKGNNVQSVSSYQWETVAANLDEFIDVSSRLYLGLGRDGLLPAIFACVYPTRHTPIQSYIGVGFIACVLARLLYVHLLSHVTSVGSLLLVLTSDCTSNYGSSGCFCSPLSIGTYGSTRFLLPMDSNSACSLHLSEHISFGSAEARKIENCKVWPPTVWMFLQSSESIVLCVLSRYMHANGARGFRVLFNSISSTFQEQQKELGFKRDLRDFLHLTSGKRKREDFPSEFGPDGYIPQQDGAGDDIKKINSILMKLLNSDMTRFSGWSREQFSARIFTNILAFKSAHLTNCFFMTLKIYNYQGPVNEDYNVVNTPSPPGPNAVLIACDRKTAALLLQRLLYNFSPQSDTDLDRKPFNNDKPILFVFDIFFFVHLQTIYKISFGQILSKPMMTESDGETATLFPKAARLRNLTYSAPLYVDATKRAIKKGHDHEETTETQDFGEVIHKNI
ncbi:DNA-directed RNA polymerase II subunit RPB2 [Artemisia annua]|uniref:DNA-directed RNA polymerase n=1 Tax=Artemisia annua TaxID=35608 RepID=A0A2U1PX31_ARTAN|nr:DNA-directed RNA polymerase II subunit RPB2 [Artemisia annua]